MLSVSAPTGKENKQVEENTKNLHVISAAASFIDLDWSCSSHGVPTIDFTNSEFSIVDGPSADTVCVLRGVFGYSLYCLTRGFFPKSHPGPYRRVDGMGIRCE